MKSFPTWHELFLLSQLRVGVSAHSNCELRSPEVLHQLAAPHVLTFRDVGQLLDVLLRNTKQKRNKLNKF